MCIEQSLLQHSGIGLLKSDEEEDRQRARDYIAYFIWYVVEMPDKPNDAMQKYVSKALNL